MLDLLQLKTFMVVAYTRNFTRAAVELGCSQSTVTHRIKELEQHLGVTLLDRSRFMLNATLTQAGLLTLAHAQQLLALVAKAESAIRTNQAQGCKLTATSGTRR
jgi:DNA-binding transcriptional LysR family regulator